MRVLLVQSKSTPTMEQLTLPLGLCYVATALMNHNHEASIYDTNVSTEPVAELRKLIRNLEPEVIGVGLRNMDNGNAWHFRSFVEPFLDLVSMLKKAAPASKILAGGSGFSIYAWQLMERVPAIDYGIFTEGEEAMPELLDNLDQPQSVKGIFYRRNGTIHFTGAREPLDFANLPAPRRNMIDLTPYLEFPFSIGVQSKRGCPYKCAYCTYPYLQGAELRVRPVQAVLDELEELVKKYGLRDFWFVDSVFNVPQSHARDMLEGMLSRELSLRWHSYDNLKFVNGEYMKLARDAGCQGFELSADGISRSTLTALNKDFSEQDIERVYSAAKQIDDVKVTFNFFINGPGESVRNLFRLIFFIARCRFILRKKAGLLWIDLIRIYPHTPIHALALEKGMLRQDDDLVEPVFYNPPPLRYLVRLVPVVRRVFAAVRLFTRLIPLF